MVSKTDVLLVTDHNLFRQCLASALNADPHLRIECAATAAEALDRLAQDPPQVVLIDLHLRERVALQLTYDVAGRCPTARTLIIGLPQSEGDVLKYLEAGAAEYVSKQESLEALRTAIDRVVRGETVYSPELARASFARLQELAHQRSRLDSISTMILTSREMQILGLIAEGMSNKEIAGELHLSLHTVKNHVHRILEKLEVKNRLEAVQVAHKNRWFGAPS